MTLRIKLLISRNDICNFCRCSTSYSGSLQIPAYFQTLSFWECLGFPCTNFIPGHISAKFCVILFANSRPLSLCSMNGAYKRCRSADRPLPRWFVGFSWSPNSLWSFPLTATTRLSHHGISSHATTRCVCLKTATTRNFALWLFL